MAEGLPEQLRHAIRKVSEARQRALNDLPKLQGKVVTVYDTRLEVTGTLGVDEEARNCRVEGTRSGGTFAFSDVLVVDLDDAHITLA